MTVSIPEICGVPQLAFEPTSEELAERMLAIYDRPFEGEMPTLVHPYPPQRVPEEEELAENYDLTRNMPIVQHGSKFALSFGIVVSGLMSDIVTPPYGKPPRSIRLHLASDDTQFGYQELPSLRERIARLTSGLTFALDDTCRGKPRAQLKYVGARYRSSRK